MKNLKLTFGLLLIVLASACTKVKDAELAQPTKITNFKEIKVADNFKWNTTNPINLNFKPTIGDVRISVLKVTSEDGAVIYQRLQKAGESHSIVLEIPAHYTKVNVSFGGTVKSFESKSGKIDMDLK